MKALFGGGPQRGGGGDPSGRAGTPGGFRFDTGPKNTAPFFLSDLKYILFYIQSERGSPSRTRILFGGTRFFGPRGRFSLPAPRNTWKKK